MLPNYSVRTNLSISEVTSLLRCSGFSLSRCIEVISLSFLTRTAAPIAKVFSEGYGCGLKSSISCAAKIYQSVMVSGNQEDIRRLYTDVIQSIALDARDWGFNRSHSPGISPNWVLTLCRVSNEINEDKYHQVIRILMSHAKLSTLRDLA